MRKVVLVNQSTGYLMIDIVNAYMAKYDQVVLIAGSICTMERPLENDVVIDKIIPYNRSTTIKRILTWLYGTLQVFFKLLFKYRHYEVVYVTNPPMCYLLAFFIHSSFSVIVYDVYPDALKNIGINDKSIFFRLWATWNQKLFSKAQKVFTLSDGMGEILKHYVDSSKIKIIPNWPASERLHPIEKSENLFIRKYKLEKKFIVLYSGNIGYTHNVECLVDVAKKIKDEKDILFLIIGEGMKKSMIQKCVRDSGLQTFMFLTWQDKDMLPYSLGAADIAVITLNDNTAQLSVPSKTYNLLAVGAPLLCIAPLNSELRNLVHKYQNGSCFEKSEVEEISSYISMLKNNPEIRLEQCRKSLIAARDFTYKNANKYV